MKAPSVVVVSILCFELSNKANALNCTVSELFDPNHLLIELKAPSATLCVATEVSARLCSFDKIPAIASDSASPSSPRRLIHVRPLQTATARRAKQ